MPKRASSFWLMVSQNCQRFVSFKELIMRRFILRYFAAVILFVSCFAQWGSAQCVKSTVKHCFLEQFSNACQAEPCQALNQFCGAWVEGNDNSYASVISAPTGSNDIERFPEPILCGTVKSCSCGTIELLLGLYCKKTPVVLYSSYWVHPTLAGDGGCWDGVY